MARIPTYPFRVIATFKVGERQIVETHNYPNLPGAWAYREIALRKHNCRRVEVVVVIDEATPSHPV